MNDATILLVHSELSVLRSLSDVLTRAGYAVLIAETSESALACAAGTVLALIVLDTLLPGSDGFKLSQALRHITPAPLIMLAETDGPDGVIGFQLGLNPTITRPFRVRELPQRIRAILAARGTEPIAAIQDGREQIEMGNLTVFPEARSALLDGTILTLAPREFDLLLFFARHHSVSLTREAIFSQVWGRDYDPESLTLESHVYQLRQRIEVDPHHPQRIITIVGHGYRFDG